MRSLDVLGVSMVTFVVSRYCGAKPHAGAASSATTKKAPMAVPVLPEAGADFDVFVGEAGQYGAAVGADRSGDDHAVGFDAAEFAGREVDHHGDFAADEFFRLVELGDASADLADFGADVDGELKQLVGADNALRGFDLADAHFDFGEVVDGDFFGR